MRDFRWLFGLALAVVAGFTWYWLGGQATTPNAPVTVKTYPDSYFRGMSLMVYDDSGKPSSRLDADDAVHYPDNETIHLTGVHAVSLRAGANWKLSADTGLLLPDSHQLHAAGNAMLTSQSGNAPPSVISSVKLDLDATRNLLTTDAPVTIKQGNSLLTGVGLRASLDDNHIVLYDKVNARYETR